MSGLVIVPTGGWWLPRAWRQGDRGSVLLVFALLIVPILLAVAALMMDSNLLFIARAEAQNAADAGALAGASCLREQEVSTYHLEDPIESAFHFARANLVLGQPGKVDVSFDGETVVVTVERTAPTLVMSAFRVRTFTVRARAAAAIVDGRAVLVRP
jgi:uncharacterized membrane protein